MSTITNQEQRVNVKALEPNCWKLIIDIETYLVQTSLDKKLRELIKMRTSQINKCAFCIDLHTKDAIKLGESERRIFALSVWEESPLFTDKERAVLQFTEEITEIAKHGVREATYQAVKKYFSDQEIAQIIISVNHMNFLNRIAVSTKMVHPS